MESVNIYAAKTRFSELVDKAAAGQDVVISRHGKPVARLTRLQALHDHMNALARLQQACGEEFETGERP